MFNKRILKYGVLEGFEIFLYYSLLSFDHVL